MADLIDRDALMKKICGNECGSVCDEECENAVCNFYDYIMDAPAVDRWIPCSERLPEDGELVLIAHVSGAVYIADHDGKYWEEDSGEWYDGENVTHWMPMPEPPEGGADWKWGGK